MDDQLVLEIPTDVRSIRHAVEYVMQRCNSCKAYEDRLQLNFRVGLTEALSNAMLYGNAHDPSKHVRVEVTLDDGRLEARITDQGTGFDPSAIPDPTAPDNILKDRGRGVFLMRQLLDSVSYNDRGNQVTLVLTLEKNGALEGGARA
jgi:serine/threonine-protein kinase RsbW